VPDAQIEQRRIDLAPVRRFLKGGDLPVLGDDPMTAGTEKPFSAAHIEIMGRTGCYLYVILGSEQYASVANMVGESYILQTALWGLGLVILVTAGVGLLLFRRLTQRLRAMQDVVADFEAGAFGRRVDVTSNDEIGRLGTCFNRMADNLEETMEELRQADRMRRELVANVSHDLRSPIASIQGYLETVSMKDGDLPPEERQRYVTTALRNTKRLNTLVNELFELSKLETKQVEPTIEAFPIAELVQDVVMQYEPRAEEQAVDLRPDLPERHARVRRTSASWSGPCRTSSTTRSTTPPRGDRSASGSTMSRARSVWRWRTRGPASRRTTCPTSSSASTGSIRAGTGTGAGPASASPSPRRSWSSTAAPWRWRVRWGRERAFASACRSSHRSHTRNDSSPRSPTGARVIEP
jgi:Signal transduction histidine kinase